MKYLFILGRNIELSRLEVLEYLKRIGNSVISEKIKGNGLFVEIGQELNAEAIKNLGGVLGIGKVLGEVDNLDKVMIYEGEKNNINYALWEYSDKVSELREYLKARFKKEKLKAVYKGLNDRVSTQDGEDFFIPSSKLLDIEYFIFEEYFGKLVQNCDYEAIEARDMEKPVRRESLAISPRLAKIMINLSGVKEGKVLDAFCGVGTVLQETLLQGLEAAGVDNDRSATEGALKNLEWFKFPREKYMILNYDSTEVNLPLCSVMVSEPDLGTTLRKTPPKPVAEKTLKNFEKLMVQVINNVKGKVTGRIVFTSPLIRLGKKRIGCDIENICERTGYKLVFDPIEEYREAQIVGRKIFVLEKAE